MQIVGALHLSVGDSTEYVFNPGRVIGMLLNETTIEWLHQLERSPVSRET